MLLPRTIVREVMENLPQGQHVWGEGEEGAVVLGMR